MQYAVADTEFTSMNQVPRQPHESRLYPPSYWQWCMQFTVTSSQFHRGGRWLSHAAVCIAC